MSRNYKFHNPDGLYFISFAGATDYAGEKGVIDDVMVFRTFDL